MSTPIKIQDSEISEVKELQNKFQEKIIQFGNLYLEKMQIESAVKSVQNREEEIQTEWKNLQKMENELIEKILKKYGEGSLDLKAGIFIPEKK